MPDAQQHFRPDFLGLSCVITGFGVIELQGTGRVEEYQNHLHRVDPSAAARLLQVWAEIAQSLNQGHDGSLTPPPGHQTGQHHRPPEQRGYRDSSGDGPPRPLNPDILVRQRIFDDATLGPLARNLIQLWYLGQWGFPVISAQAYQEGLVWKAIGAHPQGAKQQGFGTWSSPPPAYKGQ